MYSHISQHFFVFDGSRWCAESFPAKDQTELQQWQLWILNLVVLPAFKIYNVSWQYMEKSSQKDLIACYIALNDSPLTSLLYKVVLTKNTKLEWNMIFLVLGRPYYNFSVPVSPEITDILCLLKKISVILSNI